MEVHIRRPWKQRALKAEFSLWVLNDFLETLEKQRQKTLPLQPDPEFLEAMTRIARGESVCNLSIASPSLPPQEKSSPEQEKTVADLDTPSGTPGTRNQCL